MSIPQAVASQIAQYLKGWGAHYPEADMQAACDAVWAALDQLGPEATVPQIQEAVNIALEPHVPVLNPVH